jgi:uncharacterized alpha-E superfamily protein
MMVLPQILFQLLKQQIFIHGLGHIIGATCGFGSFSIALHSVRGQADDGQQWEGPAYGARGFVAIQNRQRNIHQHQIGLVLLDERHPRSAVFCYQEAVILLEDLDEQVNVKFNIFNDQDGLRNSPPKTSK